VIVSVDVPPDAIVAGLNTFVTVGACIVTVKSSEAGEALFP
jgi:carbon monoxide dehydrogenase subunit G